MKSLEVRLAELLTEMEATNIHWELLPRRLHRRMINMVEAGESFLRGLELENEKDE